MEKELFENIGISTELETGLNTLELDFAEFQALFNTTEEKAIDLIKRTLQFCDSNRLKKPFYAFVDYNEVKEKLNSITQEGLFLVCLANERNENSVPIMQSIYRDIIISHLKYYIVKNYKKNRGGNHNPNTNLTEEDILTFKLQKISSDYIDPNFDIEDKSHFFYGKKVVITGNFAKFPVRNEMAKMLYEVGADVNTSISKKTDYVIVGENAGWSKLEKIKEFNIETIDEQRFSELFNR